MDLLTLIILVLVVAWVTGAYVFPVGNVIHLLIVIIVVVVLVRLLRGERL